jgi:FMN phosphatase YigB (HAD superfamily)
MLRGLIFDMADVLYDATAWQRWLLQLLSRLGVQADYRTFYHAWDRYYLVDVQCGRREFNEAFQDFLLANGLTRGQIDEVEAACRIRRTELERDARPFPCVAATLRRLTDDGLSLAVLTNAACPAAELQAKLNHWGLGARFQSVWSSFDLEAAKPAAVCYQTALESLQLGAKQVAYVGHDARSLSGAARIGLRTIAINHESGARADIFVGGFGDLPTAIKPWRTTQLSSPKPAVFADRWTQAA